jgi:hypothetical protein
MLKTLAGNGHIEGLVWICEFFSRAYNVHIGAGNYIDSDVRAALEEWPDRSVYVVGSNFQDAFLGKIVRQMLGCDLDELKVLRVSHTECPLVDSGFPL